MSNTIIQIKYSSAPGSIPNNLQPGELAINIEDGKLFYGNASNNSTLFDVVTEPSGLNGDIQFNDLGSFGSDSGLNYNTTTKLLQVSNILANTATIGSYNVAPTIVTLYQYANSASSYANSAYLKANTAAGSNGQLQFNLNNAYGAASDLYYTSGDKILHVYTLNAVANVDAQNVIAYNKLYAGIATSLATPLPDLIAQFTGNVASYVQVNAENIHPEGSADYVATADVGDDENFYINLGIHNSNITEGQIFPLDGYLLAQGNTGQLGGNLIIATTSSTTGLKTKFFTGGVEQENLVAEFGSNEILFVPEINSNTTNRISLHSNSSYLHANAAFAYANTLSSGSIDLVARNTANTAYDAANGATVLAQAAFDKANNATDTWVRDAANSASSYANSAFVKANTNSNTINTVSSVATSAYNQANTATTNSATADQKAVSAGVYANSAYVQANTASTTATSAGSYANGAFTKANTATTNAATADQKAVTSGVYANAAFGVANTATTTATSAGSYANSAFTKANTAANNAATADQRAVTSGVYANSAYVQANTATTNAATADQKAVTSGLYANNAYIQANTNANNIVIVGSYANSAYTQANTAANNAATADQKAVSAGVYANSAYTQANTATINAASAGSYANSAYVQANTATSNAATADQKAVSAGVYANGAFTKANTATTNAATADQRAVTSGSYANSAFIKANSAFDTANTKLSSSGGTISGNLVVSGNLSVTGNVTSYSSQDLIINDPLILLANNNIGNVIDIGFIGHYVEDSNTRHTGLVKDVSANVWYLFDNYIPHIQETNILDTSDTSFRLANFTANVVTNVISIRGYDPINHTNSAFSVANTALSNAATADQKAVSAGSYANAAFGIANTASTTATSASSYANSAFAKANTIPTQLNVTDDTSTTSLYPIMVGAVGSTQTVKASSSKIYFNAATGTIYASSKSFSIPHPTKEGKKLIYGSLEGPENGVYVRGRTDSNVIELPDYWVELVDESTITVELTAIGKPQQLYVEEIKDNKVFIRNGNWIDKSIDCYFTVYGERKDIDKLQVEV